MKTDLQAVECHLAYMLTVLAASRHRWTRPPEPQPDRPVLDSPTPEGWKAELTWVTGYISRCFICRHLVTMPVNSWMHGAAITHTITPIIHTRHSPHICFSKTQTITAKSIQYFRKAAREAYSQTGRLCKQIIQWKQCKKIDILQR